MGRSNVGGNKKYRLETMLRGRWTVRKKYTIKK